MLYFVIGGLVVIGIMCAMAIPEHVGTIETVETIEYEDGTEEVITHRTELYY